MCAGSRLGDGAKFAAEERASPVTQCVTGRYIMVYSF